MSTLTWHTDESSKHWLLFHLWNQSLSFHLSVNINTSATLQKKRCDVWESSSNCWEKIKKKQMDRRTEQMYRERTLLPQTTAYFIYAMNPLWSQRFTRMKKPADSTKSAVTSPLTEIFPCRIARFTHAIHLYASLEVSLPLGDVTNDRFVSQSVSDLLSYTSKQH